VAGRAHELVGGDLMEDVVAGIGVLLVFGIVREMRLFHLLLLVLGSEEGTRYLLVVEVFSK